MSYSPDEWAIVNQFTIHLFTIHEMINTILVIVLFTYGEIRSYTQPSHFTFLFVRSGLPVLRATPPLLIFKFSNSSHFHISRIYLKHQMCLIPDLFLFQLRDQLHDGNISYRLLQVMDIAVLHIISFHQP